MATHWLARISVAIATYLATGCGGESSGTTAAPAVTTAPATGTAASPGSAPAWRVPVDPVAPAWLLQGPLGRNAVRTKSATGDSDGVALVTSAGELLWTAPVAAGDERSRVTSSAPPVFLADGGLVLCTSAGIARLDGGGRHRWKIDAPPCEGITRGRAQPLVALAGGELLSIGWEGDVQWRKPVTTGEDGGPASFAVLLDGTAALVTSGAVQTFTPEGDLAWELRDTALGPPAVAATDNGLFVRAGDGVMRLADAGASRILVPGVGPPALQLPNGHVGVGAGDDAKLRVVDASGRVRWEVPCRVPNIVAFGRLVCSGDDGAVVYRADGLRLAAIDPPGTVLSATATPEWIVTLVRGPAGATELRGFRR